jgi:hypothetical protein
LLPWVVKMGRQQEAEAQAETDGEEREERRQNT